MGKAYRLAELMQIMSLKGKKGKRSTGPSSLQRERSMRPQHSAPYILWRTQKWCHNRKSWCHCSGYEGTLLLCRLQCFIQILSQSIWKYITWKLAINGDAPVWLTRKYCCNARMSNSSVHYTFVVRITQLVLKHNSNICWNRQAGVGSLCCSQCRLPAGDFL